MYEYCHLPVFNLWVMFSIWMSILPAWTVLVVVFGLWRYLPLLNPQHEPLLFLTPERSRQCVQSWSHGSVFWDFVGTCFRLLSCWRNALLETRICSLCECTARWSMSQQPRGSFQSNHGTAYPSFPKSNSMTCATQVHTDVRCAVCTWSGPTGGICFSPRPMIFILLSRFHEEGIVKQHSIRPYICFYPVFFFCPPHFLLLWINQKMQKEGGLSNLLEKRGKQKQETHSSQLG